MKYGFGFSGCHLQHVQNVVPATVEDKIESAVFILHADLAQCDLESDVAVLIKLVPAGGIFPRPCKRLLFPAIGSHSMEISQLLGSVARVAKLTNESLDF